MKKVISRHTWMRNGTHGPSHDPYAWTEVGIETKWNFGDDCTITIMNGLVSRGHFNGQEFDLDNAEDCKEFEFLIGMKTSELWEMLVKCDYEKYSRLTDGERAMMEADAHIMAMAY